MKEFLLKAILLVAILKNGTCSFQDPPVSAEEECKQSASTICGSDFEAISSSNAFKDCWLKSYDDCVVAHPSSGQWNRNESNCERIEHTAEICYDDLTNTKVCLLYTSDAADE